MIDASNQSSRSPSPILLRELLANDFEQWRSLSKTLRGSRNLAKLLCVRLSFLEPDKLEQGKY